MKKITLLLFISIVFVLCSCQKQNTYTKTFYSFGSYMDVTLYQGEEQDINHICDVYQNYSKLCDPNYSYSGYVNIYDINQTVNQEVNISSELFDLIKVAIEYYNITNGYFNIAIGNASFKWKECINNQTYEDLSNCNVDINDIVLNSTNNSIKLLSDIKIDLGGIAKGYVNDIVYEYLKSKDINKYMISAGSSSIIVGRHKDDRAFNVGIKDPYDISKNFIILEVENNGITTSGDYESYFMYNDKKYHHILNPKTLTPEFYYHSITVITQNNTMGDVLSTALYSMSYEDALAMCDNLNIEALFFMYDGTINKTEGFIYEKA